MGKHYHEKRNKKLVKKNLKKRENEKIKNVQYKYGINVINVEISDGKKLTEKVLELCII